jgi:putative molybdopterin biosynthesis protein
MEPNLLTAEEVAGQLRIKKYTVYELIKRGELPASRVGKGVRVSREDVEKYLALGRTGPAAGRIGAEAAPARQAVICGQDKCIELLLARIGSETGVPALRSYTGCYTSLIALYFGRVTMAAAHLWDAETGGYNYPFLRRLLPGMPAGALRLAGRMQGFYVKAGNPLGIRDWGDLTRRELKMVNREQGCGTRILLDQKLVRLGVDIRGIGGYDREFTSHMACAGAVARGAADVACGCEAAAADMPGVDFIPLQLEWYDLVFRLADRDVPAVKAVRAYVDSGEFGRDLQTMGVYDLSRTGHYEEF